MARIIDLNEIGTIDDFEFAYNTYVGGETLGLSMICHSEIDDAESTWAMGSTVFVEIEDVGAYLGEVVDILYDEKSFKLDILLRLKMLDE